MIRNRWRGLPLQLFALTVLPLTLLLFAIAFGGLVLHQRAMRAMVGERDERAAQAAAAAVTEQLNHRATAVESLAAQTANGGQPEHVLADAEAFLPDFEGGLALFGADGRLLLATPPSDIWQQETVGELLAANGRSPANEAAFIPSFFDTAQNEWITLVAATTPEGMTAVGAFYPARLAERALNTLFGTHEQVAAFVVNANGQLLYHMGALSTAGSVAHPGVAQALRGDSGTTYRTVDGDEHVVAFSPITPVNWALVIEEPWNSVADPLLETTEVAPLVLAPALIITLVALWFGVRQIVQPLQALAQKATRLGKGEFAAIAEPVGGIEEIRHLQRELVKMASKVQAAQQSLRDYLEAVTTGQEEERHRLARDLHDDTLQSLIALNQRVQLAQLKTDGRAATQLVEMQQMTTQIIADLRRLTRALRPIYLEDLGLIPALDMLTRDTAEAANLSIHFHTAGVVRRLPSAVELALYRMAQEALSNVVRHAQATEVEVKLDFGPQATTFTVVDNGRGFTVPENPADLALQGHFGLLGLYERAELIGAQLTLHSVLGQGTRLTIVVDQ